jgi:probable H4MPT-linked C1 transfer pathway protein
VVRTPLCALAHRIRFCGEHYNVMNEFFATTADVYRLTGALDPLHDQQPAADGGAKDRHGTCQRLARMIGRDARDRAVHDWVDLAHRWRDAQLAHLSLNLTRVLGRTGLAHNVVLVAAGCGAFLVDALAEPLGRDVVRFDALPGIGIDAGEAGDAARGWARVCAPCVAVGMLRTDTDTDTDTRETSEALFA